MSTKKSNKKVGLTKIRRAAADSINTLNDTPALNVILEMNDPVYCEQRVIEFMRENQLGVDQGRRIANLKIAINLLSASLLMRTS